MSESRFRRAAVVIAVLAALHGVLYVPLVEFNAVTDSSTYIASSEAILDARYSTPLKAGFYYVYPLGWFDITARQFDPSVWPVREPQVFRPPGYPAYLALVGGGGEGASETLALYGQGLLFGAGTLLLALTVRRWAGERAALLAAAIYALDPWSKHYVALVLTEALAGTVVLALAYAYTRAYGTRAAAWWAGAGALAAGLTLVRAVFVFVVPLVVLAAALRGRARAAAASAVAAAALLVPWLAWTSHVLERPVLASYGQGFNLLVAAHGEGYGRPFEEVIADPAFLRDLRAPHRLAPTAAEIRDEPEAHPRYVDAADREQRERAVELIGDRLRDEPHELVWETLYRAWYLWGAHHDWYQPDGFALVLVQTLDWLLLALAAAGAALALARGGPARGVAVALLVYTVVIATHHVEARFAMPVRGLYLTLVALALPELRRRLGSARPAT